MSRLAFVLLLAVCLAESVPAATVPGAKPRANILLIVADDLGPWHVRQSHPHAEH
jgi:hypothetical protein